MPDPVSRLLSRDQTPVSLEEIDPDVDGPPRAPGIYAAWITSRDALKEIGVSGKPPVLAYVGKAAGVHEGGLGTLYGRIDRHAMGGWIELNEMLAVRGRAIFPWETRIRRRRYKGRMHRSTPLGYVAREQVLEWEAELHWNWVPCRREAALKLEKAAIREGKPLLNHAGVTGPPPALRQPTDERVAARWLWHMSWAALYTARGSSRFNEKYWGSRRQGCSVDDDAWPIPFDSAARPAAKMPDNDSLRRIMRAAARPGRVTAYVRHAVELGVNTDELQIWWAAHAGAPYLPGKSAMRVKSAIAASLEECTEEEAPCPQRLPPPAHMKELIRLSRCLRRVGH